MRVKFPKGKQQSFLESVQRATGTDAEYLAEKLGISARTVRDWQREKWHMSEQALNRLCRFAGIPMPEHVEVLPEYWSVHKAARLGGRRRVALYGSPGTPEGRQKAGRLFQQRMETNPALVKTWGMVVAKEIKHPPHSPLLAEFVGILIGDGSVRSSFQVTMSFNRAKEMAYARWFQHAIAHLFGLRSTIRLEKRSLGGTVIVSSRRLVQYLQEVAGLRPGNKLRNGLDVPDWIWARQSYRMACLRGLMDTDGGPYLHRYRVNGKWYTYPKLCFSSVSTPLLESVVQLFRDLGFHPRMTRGDRVFIDRISETRHFYELIGSRQRRHCALVVKAYNLLYNK